MNAGLRLAIFAVALAAVFSLTFFGVRAVAPATDATPSTASGPPAGSGHEEMGGADDHGSSTVSPSPVRGLSVAEQGYRISEVSAPTTVSARATLSFRLTGPDAAPVTRYDENHEKDLHLVVVRSDGDGFRHVHPTHDGAGRWSIPWAWSAAGTYRIFADFVPSDLGADVTLTSTIQVVGEVVTAELPSTADTVGVDGYTITRSGDFTTGHESTLTFTVSRDGVPVTDLQPYLGAYGHLVALRSGDLAYLHVHPMGEPGDGTTAAGPQITFMAEAPTDGEYLLYLDLKIDGVVRTAAFTVAAQG